jgi:23S rRNA pseudouridine2605 synthase
VARTPDRRSAEAVPLERLLSKWRVASRTQAATLVRAGRVTVGGRTVTDPRRRVVPGRDALALDGKPLRAPAADHAGTYLLLNKPRGTVSTTRDPEGRATVMDLVAAHAVPGLAPVGRLDQASAGLLLLTDDHALAALLLDPRSHVVKAYRVKVRGHPTEPALASLCSDSLEEDGLVLGPMQVEVESVGPRSTWLVVSLREGKNRQIRRRLEALGHEVEVLVRTRFGALVLGDLPAGAVRVLTRAEVALLRKAASAPG